MSQRVEVKRAGNAAFLVDLGSIEAAMGMRAGLEADPPDGLREVIAAATTVMVIAESPRHIASLLRGVRSLITHRVTQTVGRHIEIPVVYEGWDLGGVAGHLGMSQEAIAKWHSQQTWTSAFTGFAPGFSYMVGESPLRFARHTSPRRAVPPGSVALADNYSAVYPRDSPGGWQLIGHTDLQLWDESREDPALIQPGDRVRFTRVREKLAVPFRPTPVVNSDSDQPASAGLSIVASGVSATYQDLGRPGHAALGVGHSGAMDVGAYLDANRLVGSRREPVVEALGAGLTLRAIDNQVLAVTGAASQLVIRGRDVLGRVATRAPAPNTPFALLADEELIIKEAAHGLWSYLALRGGISAPKILDSGSRDTHSGIGPVPLGAGDVIRVEPAPASAVVADPLPQTRVRADEVELRVIPGPREDWFTPTSIDRFYTEPWEVTHHLSRTAARLQGEPLERAVREELQSEGLVRGSIQVPSSGQPLIFAADHPVTGGYPVIGVIAHVDLDLAAQLEPGATVRFVRTALPLNEET